MNVSKLTEVELNRKMVELQFGNGDKDIERLYRAGKLNYLSDYNLTMPLAKKYMITIGNYKNTTEAEDFIWGFKSSHKDQLRAICEVLVMIALEERS